MARLGKASTHSASLPLFSTTTQMPVVLEMRSSAALLAEQGKEAGLIVELITCSLMEGPPRQPGAKELSPHHAGPSRGWRREAELVAGDRPLPASGRGVDSRTQPGGRMLSDRVNQGSIEQGTPNLVLMKSTRPEYYTPGNGRFAASPK